MRESGSKGQISPWREDREDPYMPSTLDPTLDTKLKTLMSNDNADI